MTGSELRENLLVAVDTLRSHKVRSGLTVLGIVIGVTSVISVAAIITGLNRMVKGRFESLGSRTFFLSRIPAGTFGRLPQRIRTRKYLNYSDAQYLKDVCPSVAVATSLQDRSAFSGELNSVQYGSERVERVFVRGGEPELADVIPLYAVRYGRFISKYDLEHARPVVVLGTSIADSLFPHADPLGKTVRVNGRLYEVIGVFEKDPGLFGGPGVDQFAVLPLTEFRKRYPEIKETYIVFRIREGVPLGQGQNEVAEAMRRRRRVPPNGESDFEIVSPDFLSNMWDQLTGALVILTGVISSVGLLVGGIGVMNIMLISVTERTQEIGVRKAIGARRSDIRVQFLLEAVTLTMIGGTIGIVLGAVIAYTVRALVPSVPATISYLWVALGVAMSVSVGVFFGYYPANRAAGMDPIVCLRYE